MELRSRERDKAKQDYAAQLASTNGEQTLFYAQLSPRCLNVRIRMRMRIRTRSTAFEPRAEPAAAGDQAHHRDGAPLRIGQQDRAQRSPHHRQVLRWRRRRPPPDRRAEGAASSSPLLSSPLLHCSSATASQSRVTCLLATGYLAAPRRTSTRW